MAKTIGSRRNPLTGAYEQVEIDTYGREVYSDSQLFDNEIARLEGDIKSSNNLRDRLLSTAELLVLRSVPLLTSPTVTSKDVASIAASLALVQNAFVKEDLKVVSDQSGSVLSKFKSGMVS